MFVQFSFKMKKVVYDKKKVQELYGLHLSVTGYSPLLLLHVMQ